MNARSACADLDQRPSGAQPRKPQRRIDAREQDDPRVRRKVPERIVDRREALLARHFVEILEHNDQLASQPGDAVHELVDRCLDRTSRHSEPPERALPEPRLHPIDRRRNVPPQPARIVVAGVERDPRQRATTVCAPRAHGGRLAVARRSRDERHRSVKARVERTVNPRPVDHAVMDARNRELGLRERDKHVRSCCLLPNVQRHFRMRTIRSLTNDPAASPTMDEDRLAPRRQPPRPRQPAITRSAGRGGK